ncbi:MAG: DinB family protein [Phycisphaerales bacterium]|nr:DinB family protein [Phycisphaerales bacterium]MCB9862097.1 DinB family protein [Phycisphaerales bacterium]
MNVRDAIEQRFRSKTMRMREVLERFNDESAERVKVGANWNVRDLAGHFVFWANEAADRISDITKGGHAPDYDLDKVNADVYRKYRHMSFVMLLPQLRAAEERLLTCVRSIDPAALIGETPIREWLDTHLEHYDHHWPSLKEVADRA